MGFKLCVLVYVIVLCASTNVVLSDNSDTTYHTSPWERSLNSLGLSPLYNLYNKCMEKDATKSIEGCLSTQMVLLLDQMVHQKHIPLTEGIELVRKEKSSGRSLPQDDQRLTEETLEGSLPRSLEARQGMLDGIMLDKLSDFIETHTIQIDLPTGRAVRKHSLKIKKLLLPFLMGVVLKAASIIPVLLSIMGVLALKALLASKAALILTGLIGLRRILHHGNHNGQHKGSHHLLQHDLGISSLGHGLANLMHSIGGLDHQYGHGQSAGDSHGASSTHAAAALYGRSLNSVADIEKPYEDNFHADNSRSARIEKIQPSVQIPQYTQQFHYPGFTKTLVVSA